MLLQEILRTPHLSTVWWIPSLVTSRALFRFFFLADQATFHWDWFLHWTDVLPEALHPGTRSHNHSSVALSK